MIEPLLTGIRASAGHHGTAAVFDLDGTLLHVVADVRLRRDPVHDLVAGAARALTGKRESELFLEGELLFRDELAATLPPQARALVAAHQDAGHRVVLATSATLFQARPIARDLGIDTVLATRLSNSHGILTGEVEGPEPWGEHKADAVRSLAEREGIDLAASFAYSNDSEDRPLLEPVGHPVANTLTTAGPGLALPGVTLRIDGQHHAFSHRPAIFLFNHQSNLDSAVVAAVLQSDSTTGAEHGPARSPLTAPVVWLTDTILIDRSAPDQARRALARATRHLAHGTSVAIAPEGTRSPTPTPGPFEPGAFRLAVRTRVPVVPVVIHDSGRLMPRNSALLRSGTVHVQVLDPIRTDDWTENDLAPRIQHIRRLYTEALRAGPPATRSVS